ncbi:MAG: CBS domain-containing protein [Thermoplasmata archaeon]|nr:CBS domain-containing protein [Thermoplasmata archaeon]MCI4340972.1 CBS domain-containing protein [Thermoplasmata archaeon]
MPARHSNKTRRPRSGGSSPTTSRAHNSALGFYGYTVGDVMSRPAITVLPSDPLRLACARLSQRRISGLPVVNARGRPVGVLSQKDVVRLLHEKAGLSLPGGIFDLLLDAEESGRSDLLPACRAALDNTDVRAAMTSKPVTIESRATIEEAIRLLMRRRVNRLPVLRNGKLVGIVTRHDLLSGLGPGSPTA